VSLATDLLPIASFAADVDYVLKYANDMDVLSPGETVQVIMFRVAPGRSLHIKERTPVWDLIISLLCCSDGASVCLAGSNADQVLRQPHQQPQAGVVRFSFASPLLLSSLLR
jgi:hypothetical protein